MRLPGVAMGQPLRIAAKWWLARIWFGYSPPDTARLRFYRPDLFGRPFWRYLHAVLRGRSDWSLAERQLFAAFVSSRNRCSY